MTFNWQEIIKASSEVFSELLLTSILILVLIALGFILGYWSYRRQRRNRREAVERVGLRRRIRHPELYDDDEPDESWFTEFLQGISTEMMGAVITTLLFGVVMLIFQQYQSTQKRQAELFLEMGSPVDVVAIEAARQISVEGWLYDGSLNGAFLRETDLNHADLEGAILQNVNLENATLNGVNFYQADLSGANLRFAKVQDAFLGEINLQDALLTSAKLQNANLGAAILQRANLRQAELQNTNLRQANLQNADLSGANLTGANLTQADMKDINLEQANLSGANLASTRLENASLLSAKFDETTVLPDSNLWTEDSDMERYTNPYHPQFWNPCTESTTTPWYCGGE